MIVLSAYLWHVCVNAVNQVEKSNEKLCLSSPSALVWWEVRKMTERPSLINIPIPGKTKYGQGRGGTGVNNGSGKFSDLPF